MYSRNYDTLQIIVLQIGHRIHEILLHIVFEQLFGNANLAQRIAQIVQSGAKSRSVAQISGELDQAVAKGLLWLWVHGNLVSATNLRPVVDGAQFTSRHLKVGFF